VRIDAPIDVRFEEFWSAFPHRPGDPKSTARKKFREIVDNGIDPALLIERARAHTANTEALPVRYWMKAAKWLDEECWCDQSAPIRGVGAVAAAQAASAAGPLRSPGYKPAAEATPPLVSDIEWRRMLTKFAETNGLPSTWQAMFPGMGLPPANRATRVPPAIRREFGFDG
jgi:hypothetical protein